MSANANNPTPPAKLPLLISVAIVSYTDKSHYFETLDSVLEQNYPYIDLIISDDASTTFDAQEVVEYVETHKGKNILSVQVFHQPKNLGTVAHAEFCRQKAHGHLFYLLGAGDVLNGPGVFSRVAKDVIANHKANIFCGQVSNCDEELNHLWNWIESRHAQTIKSGNHRAMFSTMAYRTIIPTTGVFYRMSYLQSLGGYDTAYRLIEDAPLYLKSARLSAGIKWVENMILAKHRAGGVCHSEEDYKKPTYKAYAKDRILIFRKEVFPYLGRIYTQDITQMLKLWYSSRNNYVLSHGNSWLSQKLLRLKLCTPLCVIGSMLKWHDPDIKLKRRINGLYRFAKCHIKHKLKKSK